MCKYNVANKSWARVHTECIPTMAMHVYGSPMINKKNIKMTHMLCERYSCPNAPFVDCPQFVIRNVVCAWCHSWNKINQCQTNIRGNSVILYSFLFIQYRGGYSKLENFMVQHYVLLVTGPANQCTASKIFQKVWSLSSTSNESLYSPSCWD